MAQIKLGAGIAEIRGSIGGTVFARNRSGAYARNRSIPVNPGSALQSKIRATIGQVRELWFNVLTEAQRAAWKVYADNVPVSNRLGETVTLTGWNMFAKTNSFQLYHDKAAILDAPTEFATAEMDGSLEVQGAAATKNLVIAFDDSLPWVNEAGGRMEIYQSTPQAATKNFYKGPYQKVYTIDGDNVEPPTSPMSAQSRHVLTQGQKVFIMARIIRADGRLSSIFRAVGMVGV